MFETMTGLFSGADFNELLFLGLMNSERVNRAVYWIAFLKSIYIVRLAKAKIYFKTDSTYEIYALYLYLNDNIVEVSVAGDNLSGILVIMPEQNQSYYISPSLAISELGDGDNEHSGNLVKYFSDLEKLLVELDDIFNSVLVLIMIKLTKQDYSRPTGGKIVDQANVIGNSINRLNSMWLNNASQCLPNLIYKRSYSTDLRDRDTLSLSSTLWNKTPWSQIESYVLKQQRKLVKLAGELGSEHPSVTNLQIQLAKSLPFRLLAVRRVVTNTGSRTPGIDNIRLITDEDKSKMVESLKQLLIDAEKGIFTCKPVKCFACFARVMIPKANGIIRPLGIPTMQDRCLQALIKLVLEPLVEATSDPNSYGFRPYRSAKNAIAAVRVVLQSGRESKWILDADIKSFFDEIDHDWLINNVPLPNTHKLIVNGWLKAGASYENTLTDTTAGTPQGGIISPVLVNLTLNGLEKVIQKSISSITAGKDMRMNVYKDGVRVKMLTFFIKTVRYADDFIVIAPSKRIIEIFVKPAVEAFLSERGLRLSPEKTKIFQMEQGVELDFLGYILKYRTNWSKKYSFYKNRIGMSGIALYPQKSKLRDIIKKIRLIFKNSQNLSAYQLIAKLNPIIRGWSNYFNMGESYTYRGYLRYALYKLVWNWAERKHPKWGKKAIAKHYFTGEDQRLTNSAINTKWNFFGTVSNERRYSLGKGAITWLVDPTTVTTTVPAKIFNIPKDMYHIHGYHDDISKLEEKLVKANFASMGKTEGMKGELSKKQKGLCPICNNSLFLNADKSVIETGYLDIVHILPISKGGSKNSISNIRLVHRWCHKELHNSPNES